MIDVVMPKMGESITEGTIIEWKKKVGDRVDLDETLLEISTDKVDSEIPSPGSGIITEILFDLNDVVAVGEVIARIGQEGDAGAPDPAAPPVSAEHSASESDAHPGKRLPKKEDERPVSELKSGSIGFISPLVRSIMSKEGIRPDELQKISGSGNQGRITKKDILAYIERRGTSEFAPERFVPPVKEVPRADISVEPKPAGAAEQDAPFLNDRRYPMDRVRRKIAEHMISSQRTSAHVYSTSEADVSNLVEIRIRNKDHFKEKFGFSLTYSPMIMYAAVRAVKECPLMNSSIEDFEVVSHQNINMGLAVALPDNNLIVPVVHRCEELNFLGMARQSAALAENARNGQLQPEDIFGSTFTITNPGVFGGLTGMAIINQPNVGILSVGAFQKRPVVKETDFGDAIVIRSMVYLTLSYDHRLIDGAYGTRFLTRICELLEAFDESVIG